MTTEPQVLDPESRAAERLAHRGDPGLDVFKWLQKTPHAVMSTLSTESAVTGYPTASIVPFALDALGRPFVFIAGIALHTRNLKADDRASLFVHDQGSSGDPQKSWRASLNGHFVRLSTKDAPSDDAVKISSAEYDRLMARYSERIPKAESYAQTHGFNFWRMERIESIRYIAGFGRICSFAGTDYLAHASLDCFADARTGALVHMNEDHAQNMQEICDAYHGTGDEPVKMVALERSGCLLQGSDTGRHFFFSFPRLVVAPKDFRVQIIALLARARKVAGGA
jgi:hypothetical protein